VILAIFFYARLNKISIFSLGDIVCSVVPIGLFFGRLANFINSELWGTITSKPWGVVFSNAGPLPRHPSQLYEAFFEGILLLVILNTLLRKGFLNNSGFISGVFLSLYALFRIIIERFREPDAHIGYIFEYFTMGTLLSIPMLSGIIIVYFSLRKK
jgi:phosphatidylglycerol:prolipoprotein diacylglycerol transferase